MEILNEQEYLSVKAVGLGIWQYACGDETDIIGEQRLVDLARELEEFENE